MKLMADIYTVKIDEKGRISIPSRIRDHMDSQAEYYLRPHELGFLEVGMFEDFENLSKNFIQYAAPFYTPFKTPNNDGRVLLTERVRKLIGVTTSEHIVIFGRGNTFGICKQEKWPDIEKAFLAKLESLLPSQHPK